jgi:WD40 repeat protein
MKKTITTIIVLASLALNAFAQQAEIYPQIGLPNLELSSPALRFSPDGKWLFSNAGIFDAATGRELKRPYNTSIVGFSPDMKRYIQGTGSTIRIRDWETNAVIITIQNISGNPVFSPDGKQVAALTGDGKNIKILDASNGQELTTIDGWQDGIGRFGYSADGRNMVLANTENVKVFDIANKRQLRSFSVKVTSGDFRTATISPNGKMYVVASTTGSSPGSSRGFVKLYDTDTGREVRTLSGHNNFVTALACSPDGKTLISADRDNMMKVWDTATGRELRSTKLDVFILNVTYSANSQRIVFGTGNYIHNRITVLDAANYRELLTIRALPWITNAPYIVNEKQAIVQTNNSISLWDTENGRRVWGIQAQDDSFLYLSPDKRFFAKVDPTTNTNQGANNISIYDTATGRRIRTWPNLREFVTSNIIWSLEGKQLTTFSSFASIYTLDFWNVEDGQNISFYDHRPKPLLDTTRMNIRGNYLNSNASRIAYCFEDSLQIYETRGTNKLLTITGSFGRARWSPDGRRILTASDDGTVRIWDAQNGRQLQGSIKHEDLSAVQYSPDGRQIATGGRDEYVRAWNAENGAKLWERRVYGRIVERADRISYSADGRRIIAVAVTDSLSVYILDSATGEVVFSRNERSASLSPDGKWLITASQDGSVRIWSMETGVEKARLITYDDNEWLAMTPHGYYAASAKGDQYLNARVGNTVTGIDKYRKTFNRADIVQARLSNSARMASHRENITSVAVNPAGTQIASVALDKTIKIWDMESGKELRSISNIGGSVNAVSWSPDGKTLIHGAEDKTVRIWDAETGKAVRTINGHSDYVNEARYSPDGKRIASCADDKLIKIWDAKSGKEQRTLTGHTDLVTVIAWSPNGKQLASGSDAQEKTIRIWDANNGKILQTIPNQGGRIVALTYSPDGKKIASSVVEDKAIKIWDSETGRLIKSIPIENSGGVYSLAWSPDGKQLVSGAVYGGEDDYGTHIRIWNTETWERIRVIGENGAIYSISWTPDGRRLVAVCNFNDGQFIKVYDALSGNEL